jgi:hypothetical protein
VIPGIGALINLVLLTQLDSHAVVLGLIWLALGLAQLAYLTRGFTRKPPQVQFSEAE